MSRAWGFCRSGRHCEKASCGHDGRSGGQMVQGYASVWDGGRGWSLKFELLLEHLTDACQMHFST